MRLIFQRLETLVNTFQITLAAVIVYNLDFSKIGIARGEVVHDVLLV